MSRPVPAPSMNGRIGLSGTTSRPFSRVIAVPLAGGVTVVKFGICSLGQVTLRAAERFPRNLWKTLWKTSTAGSVVTWLSNVLAVCTTAGREAAVFCDESKPGLYFSAGVSMMHLTVRTSLVGVTLAAFIGWATAASLAGQQKPATTEHDHAPAEQKKPATDPHAGHDMTAKPSEHAEDHHRHMEDAAIKN